MIKKDKKRQLDWSYDLRRGLFVDDNALLAFHIIDEGIFAEKADMVLNHLWIPIEWTDEHWFSFLIKFSEEYGAELRNIQTLMPALKDDYEDTTKPQGNFEYIGGYKWALERIKENPQTEMGALFERVFDGVYSQEDLKKIISMSNPSVSFHDTESETSEKAMQKDICTSIINYASCDIVMSKKVHKQFKQDLNNYLDLFIHDKLKLPKRKFLDPFYKQFFRFIKQGDILSKKLIEMRHSFGEAFWLENDFENPPYIDSPFQSVLKNDPTEPITREEDRKRNIEERYKNRRFLFTHTLLAFSKLGFIDLGVITNNWDMSEEMQLAQVVGLKLKTQFADGIEAKMLGEVQADKDTALSFKKGILQFQGKEISFSKDTDPYYLLRTIFQEPGRLWHNDEIFDALGLSDEQAQDNPKKIYFASRNTNNEIAKKTTIDDFLVYTTKNVRINKKYL